MQDEDLVQIDKHNEKVWKKGLNGLIWSREDTVDNPISWLA